MLDYEEVEQAADEIVPFVPAGLELGLRNYWYPVLQTAELSATRPLALHCLGEPLVAWRDGQGQPAVAHDRCPHRGARLSAGRVLDGQLQCAFHGLRFERDGACALIPWQPEDSPVRREIHLRAYPTRELGGYIWAYLGDPARFPPPPLEAEVPAELLNDAEYCWFRMPTEVWETNWLVAVDGSDACHAVTLHAEAQAVAPEQWQGGRPKQAAVPLAERRVKLVQGSYGLRAIATDRAGNPIHHGHLLEVRGDRFILPCLTTNPIQPVPGVPPYVARLWQFPIDERRTQIVRYAVQHTPTAEARARWARLFDEVVRPRFEQISREDAAIAAAQGDLRSARGEEYLLDADAEVIEIRHRLREAFLAQREGRRLAPPPAALVYPVA